ALGGFRPLAAERRRDLLLRLDVGGESSCDRRRTPLPRRLGGGRRRLVRLVEKRVVRAQRLASGTTRRRGARLARLARGADVAAAGDRFVVIAARALAIRR